MDKSFVNIDDLVRQRLSGGEEQERAGAWMRMRELLDKEEDDKIPGFIYWRRMLGAMAVLLLLATITVGSYEYSAFRNGGSGNSGGGMIAGTANTAKSGVAANRKASSTVPATQAVVTNTAANGNTPAGIAADNNTTADNPASAAVTSSADHRTAHHTTHHRATVTNSINDNDNKLTAHNATNTSANTNDNDNRSDNKTGLIVAAKTSDNDHASLNGKTAGHLLTANVDKATATRMAEEKITTSALGKNTNTVAADSKNDKAAHLALNAGTAATRDAGLPVSSAAHTAGTSATDEPAIANTDVAATIKKDAHKPGAKTVKTTKQAKAPTAVSSVTAGKAAKSVAAKDSKEIAATDKNTKANNTATTGKNAVENNEVATDKTSRSVASASTAKKNSKTAADNNKVAVDKTSGSVALTSTAKKNIKTATDQAATAAGDATAAGSEKVAGKKATHKTVPTVEPAVLTKTTAKENTNNGKATASAKHTTVSKLALGSSTSALKTPAASAMTAKANTTAAKKTSGNASGDNSTFSASGLVTAKAIKKAAAKYPSKTTAGETADMDNDANKAVAKNNTKKKGHRNIEKIVLLERYVKTSSTSGYYHLDTVSMETVTEEYELAEYSAQVPFATTAGGNSAASRKLAALTDNSGTMKKTLEKTSLPDLANAFNDLKYKVGAVQFAPGLIGGINGTFFGPNSFKGFQFGVTGSLVLKDNLSVTGELKYFHRINNEYQMNDNFYTYTPVAGGYKKELELNWYSFSTLHSFELPVSVAYGAGNFSVFAGPNFVYTMAINTGAAQLKDPNYVSATSTSMGNDNTPKLKADDFGTRFGIGYLVGISYRLAPNMSIDFRTVQTMWDNANSSGSKTVSGELYKSPSLQVSFGYRLGGNKK